MKNKIQNSDAKNTYTFYFTILLLITISYLVIIIYTPKMNEINTIFYEISELTLSKEKINTLSVGINYYERTLHILFTLLISIPSFCILWINGYIKSRKNVLQGNSGKTSGFGLIYIGLFLILEIAFKFLIRVHMLNLSFEINYIAGTDASEMVIFYSFHILYPIIIVLPILLYIYGIYSFKKLGTEKLLSIKKVRKIDKIIIGVILSTFFILFSWFYFFSEKSFLDFQFSIPYFIEIIALPEEATFEVIAPLIIGRSSFSIFFIRIILPVVILKIIAVYIQEMRLKDIVRIKNIKKIIEIFIFMIFFSVFYNTIRFLPPIIGRPFFTLNSFEILIECFPYALIPFYIIRILKIFKKKKRIQDDLNKRIEIDVVLNRHQNIMQKINKNENQNQFDLENQPHGEIK